MGYPLLRPQTDLVHQAVIVLIDSGSFCGALGISFGGEVVPPLHMAANTANACIARLRARLANLLGTFARLPAADPFGLDKIIKVHQSGHRAGPQAALRRSWRATTTT